MDNKELAFCGLYCGGCGVYQKTAIGIETEIDKDLFVSCKGCASDVTTPWCTDCDIKTCCKNQGLRFCLECEEYPCEKMNNFINDPKYPYHLEVTKNMVRLKEIGNEAWIEEKEIHYTCLECGSKFNWFDQTCVQCGSKVS